MINPWNRLQLIFDIPEEIYPEIDISSLSKEGMTALLTYLIHNLKGLGSEFRTFTSDDLILVRGQDELIRRVVSGELIGVLGGELTIARYPLPDMTFIFEEPGFVILSYTTGPQWTPLSLTGLFEFFRLISQIDNKAKIEASRHFFSTEWIRTFEQTLKAYLNETA